MISEYIGRALPPSRPYLVGREKVREFALAVGEGAAVCTDLDAALERCRRLGYRL